MGAILRSSKSSNGNQSWRSVGEFQWESNKGIKVNIYRDVVISMTTLENKIMQILAAKELETDYSLCLHRNVSEFNHRFKPQHLFADMKRTVQSTYSPDSYIFGMSLEAASREERIRFGSRNIRINNQYKLHIPIFVLRSIRCIEKFGMSMNGVFIKSGEYEKIQEIITNISNGLEYNLDDSYYTIEVAKLLKTYFQLMPEGIFTEDLEDRFLSTKDLALSVRIRVLNLLVQMLPQINREALFLLIGLLYRMTRRPCAQVNSHLLDLIFEPILCRHNAKFIGEYYGVIQVLIDFFPAIFGIRNKQLNAIYKQMNTFYPRKMSIHLKRRTLQCNDESSDIIDILNIFLY